MTEADRCASCGRPIPEGRQVCPECEKEAAFFFTVPGEPFGKQRPKFGRGRTYTPSETKAHEDHIRWLYRAAHGPFFQRPEIHITACFAPPKTATKKAREAMLAGEIRPAVKPDWDNIGKLICDALNGFAYQDDKNVVKATVVKVYAERPRVEVRIREAGTTKGDE